MIRKHLSLMTLALSAALMTGMRGENDDDKRPAPEISGHTWLNTPSALTAEALKGKVVLVKFWHFG